METKLLQHRAVALAVFLSGSFSFAPFTPRDAAAADVAVLSAETWSAFAPEGKEVDAIYGDIVIRNQHLTTVVAAPNRLRNANMTVRDVGGGVRELALPQRLLRCCQPLRRRRRMARRPPEPLQRLRLRTMMVSWARTMSVVCGC